MDLMHDHLPPYKSTWFRNAATKSGVSLTGVAPLMSAPHNTFHVLSTARVTQGQHCQIGSLALKVIEVH